jgi:hypothetical protein
MALRKPKSPEKKLERSKPFTEPKALKDLKERLKKRNEKQKSKQK